MQNAIVFAVIVGTSIWVYNAKAEPGLSYQPIELIDLKTDIKSLIGQSVVVSGAIQTMGDMVLLKSEAMDMSPVMVDTERLPRPDRKRLLQNCSMLCEGQISGSVRNGVMGAELVAEQLTLE